MVDLFLDSVLTRRHLSLVYLVFTLDVIQTAFTTHLSWVTLVAEYGNPRSLYTPTWTSVTLPFMSAFSESGSFVRDYYLMPSVSAMVQCFFAWRIRTLRQTYIGNLIAIVIVSVSGKDHLCNHY